MPHSDHVFPPPADAVEVHCIGCGWTYMSDLMVPIDIEKETHWMCPVPGCGALGFLFDIFPTDPEVAATFGAHITDLDEGEFDDDPVDDVDEELAAQDAEFEASLADAFDPPAEWTPEMDEVSDMEDEEPDPVRYFTVDDFIRARAEGVYDRTAEEIRQRWSTPPPSGSASEDLDGPSFSDDDVPF